MARFFLPSKHWKGSWLTLDEAESRHAAQVLRIREGQTIGVLDGQGREARVRVSEVSSKRVAGEILEEMTSPAPKRNLGVAISLLKTEAWEWALEKAAELGASQIAPIIADRSVVRWNENDGGKKMEKWNRRMIEACKQCGSRWLPVIEAPQNVSRFLESLKADSRKISSGGLASLDSDAIPIRNWVDSWQTLPCQEDRSDVHWIAIGPEGDWTSEETKRWVDAGWNKIHLGDLVLRAETAVVASLAVMALA